MRVARPCSHCRSCAGTVPICRISGVCERAMSAIKLDLISENLIRSREGSVFRHNYLCRNKCNVNADYCVRITLFFAGRKFREKRIYCSRENIFPRKYLPAKISSRENILSRKYFPRKYPPAKIVCLFRQRSFLFAVCCPVIGETGSRPNVRSLIRIRPAQQWHNSYHFESRSFLYLADEKHSAQFKKKKNPDGLTTLRMPVIPTIIGYYL